MAIYRYKHEACGFEQSVYLANTDKETVLVPCYRCGAKVTARQVRDKSIKIREADGTTGVLKREPKE